MGGGGGGRVQDGEKEAMLSWARCLYHYVPGKGGGEGGGGDKEEGRKGGGALLGRPPAEVSDR